jgi:hypothetical protein
MSALGHKLTFLARSLMHKTKKSPGCPGDFVVLAVTVADQPA